MRIDIITVLPEMLDGFFNCSIMSRAQKKGIAEFHIHNLRDYTFDRYRKVDDYLNAITMKSSSRVPTENNLTKRWRTRCR